MLAPFALGLGALVFVPGCQTTEAPRGKEIGELVRQGRYDEALRLAEKLVESHPDDEYAQMLFRDTQVHQLLDRCRELVFDGRSEEGLEALVAANEIDPTNPLVHSWVQKIRIQLAEDWLNSASELRNADRLEEARMAYEASLAYVPPAGDRAGILETEAKLGLARVLLLQNYRAGLSKSRFDQGLRSFHDYLLHQARHSFSASETYDPENDRALARGEQVDVLLAEERLALALAFEEEGLYFAARNEFRLVLLVDPESLVAKEGLDRMDREVRVTRSLDQVEMEIRRGSIERAGQILNETASLTEAQRDAIQRLQGKIEDARLQGLYIEARSFENDFRYPEAIAAYDRLLEIAPYYEDAISRRKTLVEWTELAEEYYAKALDAENDEEAEDYLRRIELLWPEYRDVGQRLDEIAARRGDGGQAEQQGGQ